MDSYTFRIKITKIIDDIRARKSLMSPEAIVVMNLLVRNWRAEGCEKMTQLGISRNAHWLGSHKKYEKGRTNETTLRQVRQVIRDLRIEYGAPILSDAKGYWIPKSDKEVTEYLSRIEIEAKAQAKAWFETYSVMDKMLGMKSKWFEAQKKLFEPEQGKLI